MRSTGRLRGAAMSGRAAASYVLAVVAASVCLVVDPAAALLPGLKEKAPFYHTAEQIKSRLVELSQEGGCEHANLRLDQHGAQDGTSLDVVTVTAGASSGSSSAPKLQALFLF